MPSRPRPQNVRFATARSVGLLSAVALLIASYAGAETEWTLFRGPNGSGVASEERPEFKLLARNRLEGDDGDFHATPALAGGQLFLRSNRNLYCIALPKSLGAAR